MSPASHGTLLPARIVLVLVLVVVLDPSGAAPAGAGEAPDLWVKLPAGSTPLAELGAYRVAYQLYGGERVEMPAGWSGYFTEDVGVAYYAAGTRGGRRAYVLHCPWKHGTGPVRLEYSLIVPKMTPVVLSFGIAMRPDITEQSDGVTFSAFLAADGKSRQLMHEHYTKGEWKDFRFDLSEHAGRRIVVAFQTEPGPEHSASFDFSMFGEPTITVGRATDTRDRLLRQIAQSRAYRRTAQRGLTGLANRHANGVVPSANDPHETRVKFVGDAYRFEYRGDDCRIEYTLPLTDGSLSAITARVDDSEPFRPCQGGGIQFAPEKKGRGGRRTPERAELVRHKLEGKSVTATWRYHAGDTKAEVTWVFQLVGKALAIAAESRDKTIARFSLGQPWTKGLCRRIRVPYLTTGQAAFLRPQNVYVMGYLDWTKSMASRTPAGEALYIPRLDTLRNPLKEAGYVAVSPELGEVLPNIPHPPSPYLKLLGPKVMLDIWGGHYDKGAELFRTLKSYGVDHAAVIWHVWQRYGYDVKLPDHLPADPRMGGDEAMTRLAAAAREVAYPFSLHENYIDFYPDAPSYDPAEVVLTPKGEFSKAWYHKGTKVQSFALKAHRMVHYASQNSPEIHRRFGTTAAYLDVHTCVPPWHHVDYDPKSPLAGAFHAKVLAHAKLFQYERDVHRGPLFGEGSGHFYWAGLCDGVEAQVGGGEDRELLVDFDLLKLHPQMVNHGMGYYTRWLRTGRQTKWWAEAPTPEQLDKYRCQEIAYGHAGFVGSPCVTIPYFVWREHNIVTPVQALYGTAKATEILYEVKGKLVTSSAALPCGTLDRVRVAYDSGLVVHVNQRKAPWRVGRRVLPQYGFLAKGPDLLAYTALVDDTIVDYAENNQTLFVDARTHVWRPWERNLAKIEPRLKAFKDTGDGTFEITYEWVVSETLAKNYIAFVHFCDPEPKDDEDDIRFQNDHELPTSQWREGTVVADGPHRVGVARDDAGTSYDILIGLHAIGEGRLGLLGTSKGSSRILIGQIGVEREGTRVKSLKLLPIDDARRGQLAKRRVFDERMNTAGKLIDFGTVRTDGSFKLYKRGDRLTLLPYPREKEFSIELDVRTLAGVGRSAAVRIDALDAEGKRLGGGDGVAKGGWVTFRAGAPGVARFEVTFP